MKNLTLTALSLLFTSSLFAGSPKVIQYGHNFLPVDGDKLVISLVPQGDDLYNVVSAQKYFDFVKGQYVNTVKNIANNLKCDFEEQVVCEKNELPVDGARVRFEITFDAESLGTATLTRSTYDWANMGGIQTTTKVVGTELELLSKQ